MEITNVMEFEQIAKKKLPKMVYDYYSSGADDQWTLKENREAFSKILFRPRVLIDVSRIDMTTRVLSFTISMPIMIAPTGMQKMAHPEGEYATARAASAAGTIMTLSTMATSSIEEVASTGPGVRFFQLYVFKDRNLVEQLVRRAERAGFKAIALTVDTPWLGRREADIKNRFTLPPLLALKNFEGLNLGKLHKSNDSALASYAAEQLDRSLSWKGDIEESLIASTSKVPEKDHMEEGEINTDQTQTATTLTGDMATLDTGAVPDPEAKVDEPTASDLGVTE